MLTTCSKIKIFLADQSAARLASKKRQLESMGYATIFSFASPDACIKRLPLRPDLILLPCPVKSPEGMSLLRKIRAINRQAMVMSIGEAPVEAIMRRAERRRARRRIKHAIVMKITAIISPIARFLSVPLPAAR